MTLTISLLAILLLVAILLYARRNSSVSAQRPSLERPEPTGPKSQFHAVSIKLGPQACDAAQDMVDKRFLSGAAPRIPLPNCNVLECKCRFVHHKDRRAAEDRRSPFGQGAVGVTGKHLKEQRQGQERRHDDVDKLL